VLNMWPWRKYFSHPNLVVYFFSNPTHKTETGTANSWETPSKSNHLDQSLSETLSSKSDHIYYTLFCRCTMMLRISQATANCSNIWSQNHQFLELNWHVFTFFHLIILLRRSHSHHCWRWSSAPILPFSKRENHPTTLVCMNWVF
jgi:hypothetical protein